MLSHGSLYLGTLYLFLSLLGFGFLFCFDTLKMKMKMGARVGSLFGCVVQGIYWFMGRGGE